MPFKFAWLWIVIPFTELMILLKVGEMIGFWGTVGLILLTAFIGVQLFRSQGLQTWHRLQSKLNAGEMPSTELTEGLLILMAGVMMITPGLLTDALGFLCLIPVTRKLLVASIGQKVVGQVVAGHSRPVEPGSHSSHSSHSPQSFGGGRTIEGDYQKDE
ncbi:FxsA family protein [Pleionea sp. CnH1-48]|uniref:FxsA family protein n=1 Tax=Pleionea sp. CnH1-48 TaxID=2954494 RepID=UPI002096F6A2|nr:FxsA family protein [Pleionea sp. CnH1-48]MCO7224652.1 FxsA family protein [Pleionea sp. CnH1-48]